MTSPRPVVVQVSAGAGALRVGEASLADRAAALVGPAPLASGPADLPAPGPLLVLDVAHALVPEAVRDAVLAAGAQRPDAVVVPVRDVTDTLKAVDGEGRVRATVDRAARREVLTPVLLPERARHLLEAEAFSPGWQARLCAAAAAQGVPVVGVPVPGHVVVVRDATDVRLAGGL
ncbi:MAG: 2-C-methyl-D-erythritol 4-phosphate cytidylyltransferase [Kineosporiaceae bacterium]